MNSTVCPKILLIAISLILLGSVSQLRGQWPTDFQNVGGSFFELSAKVYDRPGDDFGFPVIVDQITNAVLLDSGDITDLDGGAGAKAYFGSTGPRGRKWEARTFLTNWSNEYMFDQPNLTSPLSPMFDPDSVELFYHSELFSVEFNLRKPLKQGITFITGPRFIQLNEDLLITSDTNFVTPPLPGSFDLATENTIETRNSLVGGQIGALINMPVSRDIYFNGFIRAGGYANFMELTTSAMTTLMDEEVNVFTRSTSSFVGEVGGKVYVDLIPGTLSGFVGYEATWIDGVALAPAQAVTLNPNSIFSKVTPFFQAVTFGFRIVK